MQNLIKTYMTKLKPEEVIEEVPPKLMSGFQVSSIRDLSIIAVDDC